MKEESKNELGIFEEEDLDIEIIESKILDLNELWPLWEEPTEENLESEYH